MAIRIRWWKKLSCFDRILACHRQGLKTPFLPCDAMHSAAIAGMRCPSVTFVSCAKTNKDIFKIFTPSGSQAILVFPYRTWRYFDGNPPNEGVEWKGGMKNDDFRPISRSVSETVIARWAHAARQFVSIEFSFNPYNI